MNRAVTDEQSLRELDREILKSIDTANQLVIDAGFSSLARQARKWAGDLGQIRYEVELRLRPTEHYPT